MKHNRGMITSGRRFVRLDLGNFIFRQLVHASFSIVIYV